MRLLGANPAPQIVDLDKLAGKSNYFLGNDPKRWRTNVPDYSEVEYRQVYPGIDLVYYGKQRELEHDFVVGPGADPGIIRLGFDGIDKLSLDGDGNLVLNTIGGEVVLRQPIIYQEVEGIRRGIKGGYLLVGEDEVGFEVSSYDENRPLIIDPVLLYSTYLGGAGWDSGRGIAVDSSGNAYLTGNTRSSDFPTTAGALDSSLGGASDAFVVKVNLAPTNTPTVTHSPTLTAIHLLLQVEHSGGTGDAHSAKGPAWRRQTVPWQPSQTAV